ncbi:MAG: DUF4126 domain-containing protein [Calothrix sp. C42_A2020_038]|nr:DUF4126 domain-containing protein [Calothrix sp. C42_A2020_038]
MIEVLAALSASAAAGIRIALPLLFVGLLQGQSLWSQVPILSRISSPFLLVTLTSLSILEVLASKKLTGQRVLQVFQLFLSPIVGAIMGLSCVNTDTLYWLVILFSGSLAFVLKIVQVGWFFRLRGLPVWAVFIQDFLCAVLVIFAYNAPWQGGVIALLLLWLAIRSFQSWYDWYRKGKKISKN